jgi:hypothetical protein
MWQAWEGMLLSREARAWDVWAGGVAATLLRERRAHQSGMAITVQVSVAHCSAADGTSALPL